MSLPFTVGFKLIEECINKNQDEQLWDLYKLQYPQMTKETFKTFAAFKEDSIKAINQKERVKNKTKEDILKDAMEISRRCSRGNI